jgi:hypothetical protein
MNSNTRGNQVHTVSHINKTKIKKKLSTSLYENHSFYILHIKYIR